MAEKLMEVMLSHLQTLFQDTGTILEVKTILEVNYTRKAYIL